MISSTTTWRTQVSYSLFCVLIFVLNAAIRFFNSILGPEEEGKVSHVTEIKVSERATGTGIENEGQENEKEMRLVEILKLRLKDNKPKKKKKGKGKKKKKKWASTTIYLDFNA